jgi:LysM repeat protein
VFGRILIVGVVALMMWAVFVRDTDAGSTPRFYRVLPGDTLWSISAEHFGGDPREGVWKLQQRNELESATIVPGQRLALP